MNEPIYFYFAVQVLRRKSDVYILKVSQGDEKWVLYTEERY